METDRQDVPMVDFAFHGRTKKKLLFNGREDESPGVVLQFPLQPRALVRAFDWSQVPPNKRGNRR